MSTWGSRKRNDRGAAAVETALCLCFLVIPLVFGTIAYAYMLSFRQTMSQAAAEGARAAAVVPSDTVNLADARYKAARNAASSALSSGAGGMTCTSANVTCEATPIACVDTSATGSCYRVKITYPYRAHSLLPTIPGLGFTLPEFITYSAVAEVG